METSFGSPLFVLLFLVSASVFPSNVITIKQGHRDYIEDFRDDTHVMVKRAAPSETLAAALATTSGPVQKAASVAADRFLDEDALDNVLKHEVIVPEEKINETINNKLMDGDSVNGTQVDNHRYYKAAFLDQKKLWVDLDSMNQALVKEHAMLSKAYRRAATIPLTFNFPFYGHNVTNVTIATGGFLYTGDYVHSWLAATQYIAPLMANFDTSQNDDAKIRYADNGTALIVEWKDVHLKGRDSESKPKNSEPFSFQAILHSNGDIIFAYKAIPVTITVIGDKNHPVKVGLSDAYIIDRTIFFVRRKTIYEYHRLDLKEHKITSSSAIYFTALATCNSKMDCQSCIDTAVEDPEQPSGDGASLNCKWCPVLNRCSDGMDRLRQEWLMNSCDTYHRKKGARGCGSTFDPPIATINKPSSSAAAEKDQHEFHPREDYGTFTDVDKKKLKSPSSRYSGGIVAVSIVLLLVLSLAAWFVYAYFFPHSWSGQLLIKYRPSHWQWRRAEPRYTAASIHM